jgi:hypothetical protein
VPVASSGPLALVITYHTDNRQPRSCEILVDGQRVGDESLPKSSEARFVDARYVIPAALIQGKQKITVRVQGSGDLDTGAVFGVRLIRSGSPER